MAESADDVLQELLTLQTPSEKDVVFVVDDEPVIIHVIVAMLEGENYEVSTYDGGDAALEAMSAAQPALVMTDKNLPDLSGLDLIRLGRKASPDTEFLMMTGYSSLESAIAAMDLGAFGYLAKPFRDVNEVRERVLAAVAKNRAIKQNRLLVEQVKSAYSELYKSKVEIEMLNEVAQESLRLRKQEIKQVLDEVLQPLSTVGSDARALVEAFERQSDDLENLGRAKIVAGLVETVKKRADELSETLAQSAESE